MTIVVDVSVPPDAFALGRTFEVGADVVVELEEVIPTGHHPAPYFWVSGDVTAFEAEIRADQSVGEVSREFTVDDTALFHVRWTDRATDLLDAITDADGTILRGTGKDSEWTFTLRFPDDASAMRFRSACDEADIPLDVRRLKYLTTDDLSRDFGLTGKQRETLPSALERGYFDVPGRRRRAHSRSRSACPTRPSRRFCVGPSPASSRRRSPPRARAWPAGTEWPRQSRIGRDSYTTDRTHMKVIFKRPYIRGADFTPEYSIGPSTRFDTNHSIVHVDSGMKLRTDNPTHQ